MHGKYGFNFSGFMVIIHLEKIKNKGGKAVKRKKIKNPKTLQKTTESCHV